MSDNRQDDLKRRWLDQCLGADRPAYSEGGPARHDDRGDLSCVITTDLVHGRVRLDFGKEVVWADLTVSGAVAPARELIRRARTISKEPISIDL